MTKRQYELYLKDILTAIAKIEEYTQRKFEKYLFLYLNKITPIECNEKSVIFSVSALSLRNFLQSSFFDLIIPKICLCQLRTLPPLQRLMLELYRTEFIF